MWVKVKETGQEIEMYDGSAHRLIAVGEAAAIDPPKSASVESYGFVTAPPPQSESDTKLWKEAYNAVLSVGLPAAAQSIVFRLLKLERRVAELEAREV